MVDEPREGPAVEHKQCFGHRWLMKWLQVDGEERWRRSYRSVPWSGG